MNRTLDGVGRLGAPILVLLAAVTGVLTTLAANGFALRHACVPQAGLLGFLTSDLALVRETSGCPATTVPLGADPGTVVTVVIILALPVLLAQVGALALWAMVSAVARRVLWRLIVLVLAVIDAVLALVRAHLPVPSLSRARPAPAFSLAAAPRSGRAVGALLIRGPPAGALAVA